MSEVTKPESGLAENSESGASDDSIEVNRSAKEYAQRVVELSAENKKRKAREQALSAQLDELTKKLNVIEESKIKEQGEFKSLYEKTKSELDSTQKKMKEIQANYAWKVTTSQIASEASKLGCVDTEALIQLAGSSDLLSELDPDENFNVPEEQLKQVVEKAQNKWGFMFGKPAPNVKTGAPVTKPKSPQLTDIPINDRIKMLADLTTQGKTQAQKPVRP